MLAGAVALTGGAEAPAVAPRAVGLGQMRDASGRLRIGPGVRERRRIWPRPRIGISSVTTVLVKRAVGGTAADEHQREKAREDQKTLGRPQRPAKTWWWLVGANVPVPCRTQDSRESAHPDETSTFSGSLLVNDAWL